MGIVCEQFTIGRPMEGIDWGVVAHKMGRTPQVRNSFLCNRQDCAAWFAFLTEIIKVLPGKEKARAGLKKRKRRKATEIERRFICQVTPEIQVVTDTGPRVQKIIRHRRCVKISYAKQTQRRKIYSELFTAVQ